MPALVGGPEGTRALDRLQAIREASITHPGPQTLYPSLPPILLNSWILRSSFRATHSFSAQTTTTTSTIPTPDPIRGALTPRPIPVTTSPATSPGTSGRRYHSH